jgi:hypothetical protein
VRLKLTKATVLAKQKIANSGVQEFRSDGVVERGVVERWSGGAVERWRAGVME